MPFSEQGRNSTLYRMTVQERQVASLKWVVLAETRLRAYPHIASSMWCAFGPRRKLPAAQEVLETRVAPKPHCAGSTVKWSRQQTTISPRAPVRIMGAGRTQNGFGMKSRFPGNWPFWIGFTQMFEKSPCLQWSNSFEGQCLGGPADQSRERGYDWDFRIAGGEGKFRTTVEKTMALSAVLFLNCGSGVRISPRLPL
jgi:hypothetical protein